MGKQEEMRSTVSLCLVVVMVCTGYLTQAMNRYKSEKPLHESALDAIQKVSFVSKEIAGWERL